MIVAISMGAAVTSQTRWPCVEVQLGERAGARPDAVGDPLVEDLLAELLELADGVPGDEGEGRGAGIRHVLEVLDPDDAEVGLLPRSPEECRVW